jgi:hypothetical protein
MNQDETGSNSEQNKVVHRRFDPVPSRLIPSHPVPPLFQASSRRGAASPDGVVPWTSVDSASFRGLLFGPVTLDPSLQRFSG